MQPWFQPLSAIGKGVIFLLIAALTPIAVAGVDDGKVAPKLWDTRVETVSHRLYDNQRKGWQNRTGQSLTNQLCLLPYKPKPGKVPLADADCRYTKVADRGERVTRRRVCTNEFGIRWETGITGTETATHYDLRQSTVVKDRSGRKLEDELIRETGRMVGDCPAGMRVHHFGD